MAIKDMRIISVATLLLVANLLLAQTRQLHIVEFQGSGYELGLQHGKALSNEISEIVTKWNKNTERALGKDSETILDEFFAHADFDESIKKWTPDLYAEVQGIADGSGQPFRNIMVLNLLDEFWVWIDELGNHHCSDLGVPARNGQPAYVAQNMDIESYTDGYQTLIKLTGGTGAREQLIFTHPGLIVLNGMNSEGVGVVVNTIMQLKASNTGLPVAFAVRRLVQSSDKQDILEFIQTVPHASGQSYIIGIDEEVFNFEASAGKVVRLNPGNANGTVYHTNHPVLNDNVKQWHDQYIPESIDPALVSSDNSYIRFRSVERRMAHSGLIDSDVIMSTLRSRDDPSNPVCRSNNGRGFTFGSTIMTTSGDRHLLITAGPPDESEYQRVDFSRE